MEKVIKVQLEYNGNNRDWFEVIQEYEYSYLVRFFGERLEVHESQVLSREYS